jgi:hypothetical protein
MKTIKIRDPMGHHVELGRIPDEDVELASRAINSLAITSEASRPCSRYSSGHSWLKPESDWRTRDLP